jgi:hypothetical protein
MSESGVMLLLLLDNVGSYMRTESGELDLSLGDGWGGGLEKKSEGSGNRRRKRWDWWMSALRSWMEPDGSSPVIIQFYIAAIRRA